VVDNQHKKIKDYRDLSQEEIDLMNDCKQLAEKVRLLIDKVNNAYETDGRWLSIAKTDLQKGFMFLVRSIAKPESF